MKRQRVHNDPDSVNIRLLFRFLYRIEVDKANADRLALDVGCHKATVIRTLASAEHLLKVRIRFDRKIHAFVVDSWGVLRRTDVLQAAVQLWKDADENWRERNRLRLVQSTPVGEPLP